MKIAIFGATSFIAKDLIHSFALNSMGGALAHQLDLYSRNPNDIVALSSYQCLNYAEFSENINYDAIINFIGIGDPGKGSVLGESIFHTTRIYDQMIMRYLQSHTKTKYIFISSGAVYGNAFIEPVAEYSLTQIPINSSDNNDWYAKSKLFAELGHRANSHLAIIDLRVFNYFSSNIDLNTKYLICDVINALISKKTLSTSSENIWRDYLSMQDFYQLIHCLLHAPSINTAFDCYSAAPIDKISLLETMQKQFGLCYTLKEDNRNIGLVNYKKNYYSLNKAADSIGYKPVWSSVDCLIRETGAILNNY